MPDVPQKLEFFQTADGSPTLFSPRFDEHYHSRHGARQESMHVFIAMGLHHSPVKEETLRIFEMGFGTGLNALLTMLYRGKRKVHYTALEAFPLDEEMTKTLHYGSRERAPQAVGYYQNLHLANWGRDVEVEDGFTLHKIRGKLEAYQAESAFDLIYYDAFAPSAQPELWTPEMMAKCFDMLNPGGIWVSYCAKGAVRRGLQAAGFKVERLPGPPGKREMLRAQRPQKG